MNTKSRKNAALSSRRTFIKRTCAIGGLTASAGLLPTRFAIGATAPVKVGIMLPFTGVYAQLGENIADALKMRIAEAGGTLGGRTVEFIQVDSEAAPPKAVDNATKLVKGKGVDFIIGPVHSGVGLAMTKVMKKSPRTIMVVPNAGANQITREACAPNIFRASFSNWQTGYPMGAEFVKRGHKKVLTIAWNYAAGQQIIEGFVDGYKQAGGGEPVKQLWPDFKNVEFQSLLTHIADIKPDAVFSFFSGGGAIKFVKDYDAALDRTQIPLYGAFITEGTLTAQGKSAEGIVTAMHWADTLQTPENIRFMQNFNNATGRIADVFAVQGYDSGSLLVQAMNAVQGDSGATAELIRAMETTVITDSPRGSWHMSPSHNPVQDFYLRRVEDGKNKVIGMAHSALADPATGCNISKI